MRLILKPSLSDFLFFAIFAWLFLATPDAWSRLLLDGDTGWHIRAGQYILAERSIPAHDLFSFSKAGQPWFAWEWGADLIFAALFQAGGFKALLFVCGAIIAAFPIIVFRWSLARGSDPLISLTVALLVMGACSVHFLARPHLFTLILLPVALWILESRRHLWILIPLTIVWTNLHGGFLAFIACLGLMALGERSIRLGLLTAACALATLCNPYSYHLHLHVWDYLHSDWIKSVINEFQAPSFRGENLFQFELLLLAGLMAGTSCLWRRRYTELLWLLFWAHQSLTSVRHVTVFATLAGPVIATEATFWWRQAESRFSARSVPAILAAIGRDLLPQFNRWSVWPVVGLAVLSLLPFTYPADFPSFRFPTKLVTSFQNQLARGRVLTTDQWADYLIYRLHPSGKVFFDGRSDFYGPSIGGDYIRLANGQLDWRAILDRYRFDVALLPSDWALSSLLKHDPEWRVASDDGIALVFLRRTPVNPLMRAGVSAETPLGADVAPHVSYAVGRHQTRE